MSQQTQHLTQWVANAINLADDYANMRGIELANVSMGTHNDAFKTRTLAQRADLIDHLSTPTAGITSLLEQCFKSIDDLLTIIRMSDSMQALTDAEQQLVKTAIQTRDAIQTDWTPNK